MPRGRRRTKPVVPKAGPVRVIHADGTVEETDSLSVTAGSKAVRNRERQIARHREAESREAWRRATGH